MERPFWTPIERSARYLAVVGFSVLALMAIWILVDIFSGIFGLGLPGMVDWVEVLNVICIALPLPYVTLHRKHICMDLIGRQFTGRKKRIQEIVIPIIVLFYSSILSWRLSVEALYSLKSWESVDVGMTVYWFPGKIALALGFITMSLVLILQIVMAFSRRIAPKGDRG